MARVVVGLRHPLRHLRSEAIGALQDAGVQVDVLGEARCSAPSSEEDATYAACLTANEVRQFVECAPLEYTHGHIVMHGSIAP